jgi:hypothetical protein
VRASRIEWSKDSLKGRRVEDNAEARRTLRSAEKKRPRARRGRIATLEGKRRRRLTQRPRREEHRVHKEEKTNGKERWDCNIGGETKKEINTEATEGRAQSSQRREDKRQGEMGLRHWRGNEEGD